MISRYTSPVPKEDGEFPRLLYSDSRYSQSSRWCPKNCCLHPQICHWCTQSCWWCTQIHYCAPRCSQTCHNHSHKTHVPEVLATGPRNPPVVWVWAAKTVHFGSNPVQTLNLLQLGRPKPDRYPSTGGFCCVWLDPLVQTSSSGFQVDQFMVTFGCHTADRIILTFVRYCPFRMYWPPLKSKSTQTRSLPHSEHESQQ